MPGLDRDYAAMSVPELRVELARTAGQLATWTRSLAQQRQAIARPFYEAYVSSQGRSHAERMKDAEAQVLVDQGEITAAEGEVDYHSAIRDMIVTLIEHPA